MEGEDRRQKTEDRRQKIEDRRGPRGGPFLGADYRLQITDCR
jgi:hypothetical protein